MRRTTSGWAVAALVLLIGGCAPPESEDGSLLEVTDHLAFTVVEGGPDPAPQPVGITNAGTCPLQLTITSETTDGASWLTTPGGPVIAAGGSGQLSIGTTAGTLGLTPGTWTGTVTLDAVCTVTGLPAAGTGAEISVNLTVVAAGVAWPVSGAVSGLNGSITLTELGSAAYTTLTADGPFAFAVDDGAPFEVTITAQPGGQTCTVANGIGTVNGSAVTGIAVTCPQTCPQDALEPNDSINTVVRLPTTPTSLQACPGDEDWFMVELASWTVLDLEAIFSASEGNLDLEIVELGTNAVLASATSTTDDEELGFSAPYGPADFAVHVDLVADAGTSPGTPYSLSGSVSCMPDAAEPNDSQAVVASVAAGLTTWSHCGDVDWFSPNVAPWEDVLLQASYLSAEGNIDLDLVDASGSVLQSSQGTSGGELLSWTGEGDVRVTMTDAGTNPGNGYDLDVLVTCPPDSAEPNDAPGTAAQPTLPLSGADYHLCAGDQDWFEVLLGPGDQLDVSATTGLVSEGDIALELQDVNGGVLASSQTANPVETVSYTANSSEWVRFGITLPTDGGDWDGQSYTLDASVGLTCVDDGYEENDSSGAATALAQNLYPTLQACPNDEDWYAFTVNGGDFLTVTVFAPIAEGNVDLYVYEPGGGLAGQSTSTTDFEDVFFQASVTGVYLVQVVLASDAGFSPGAVYDLDVASGT